MYRKCTFLQNTLHTLLALQNDYNFSTQRIGRKLTHNRARVFFFVLKSFCNECSIHHTVILLKSAKFHNTGPCISARSFFFLCWRCIAVLCFVFGWFSFSRHWPTCQHGDLPSQNDKSRNIRVYYHQCRCSAFLNWKIKRNLDKALTRPRRRKNVGTKLGSLIPGGKSLIRILKLKSGTITEIP